jgi:hypothetical protein
MLIIRYLDELGQPTVGLESDGQVRPLPGVATIAQLSPGCHLGRPIGFCGMRTLLLERS